MPKTLTEVRKAVARYVQDADKNLLEEDFNAAIDEAAFVLSKRNPRLVFEEKTGDGAVFEWALATATFIIGLSKIKNVYWPWEDDDTFDPLPPLQSEAYLLYEKTADVWYLKSRGFTPSSTEVIRIQYTSKHVVSDTVANCTIQNPQWENDVSKLAASFCLQMLSARSVAVGNPNYNADTVNYQSRSGEYARRAKELLEMSGLKAYVETSMARGGAVFMSMGKTNDPTKELI